MLCLSQFMLQFDSLFTQIRVTFGLLVLAVPHVNVSKYKYAQIWYRYDVILHLVNESHFSYRKKEKKKKKKKIQYFGTK